MKGNRTLCWRCKNANPKCSWHNDFTPVKGWNAKEVYIKSDKVKTFMVINCPNFEPDNGIQNGPSYEEILSIKYGVSIRTIRRWKQFGIVNEMIKKYNKKQV